VTVDGSTVRNPASNPTTGWDGGKNSLVNNGINQLPFAQLESLPDFWLPSTVSLFTKKQGSFIKSLINNWKINSLFKNQKG